MHYILSKGSIPSSAVVAVCKPALQCTCALPALAGMSWLHQRVAEAHHSAVYTAFVCQGCIAYTEVEFVLGALSITDAAVTVSAPVMLL